MLDYKRCKERIEREIEKLNLDQPPAELYEPINYVLAIGGKRIRPCLMMLSSGIFDENIEGCIQPALAIEVFHNFTLLHDDIMDNAVLRRNHPAVHIKWNTNVAILSGDDRNIQ
jgi:geranylgeranyl diphosphate synthase type II